MLATLDAILATEISPELVPAEEGEIPQSTEAKIGPYALQDFTLFHTLRYGFAAVEDRVPGAARLGGCGAWRLAAAFPGRSARGAYDLQQIRHWMEVFLRAVLRIQPVQAQCDAERPEGERRRVAVAARRLAGAVGRQCRRLAGGAGTATFRPNNANRNNWPKSKGPGRRGRPTCSTIFFSSWLVCWPER